MTAFSIMMFLKSLGASRGGNIPAGFRTSEVTRTWSLAEFMIHPSARLVSTKKLLK